MCTHGLKEAHMRVHARRATFFELDFQGGSKNLCSAQAALEQITLFDLLDFGLLFQETSWERRILPSRGAGG